MMTLITVSARFPWKCWQYLSSTRTCGSAMSAREVYRRHLRRGQGLLPSGGNLPSWLFLTILTIFGRFPQEMIALIGALRPSVLRAIDWVQVGNVFFPRHAWRTNRPLQLGA